ncbi:hypothetical protein Tco_0007743 [Tanacetum coccineum]
MSSDDNTNVVNATREQSLFIRTLPGFEDSYQFLPHIWTIVVPRVRFDSLDGSFLSTMALDIDYVDASHPNVEIVSLEVVEIVYPEVGRIDDDILLTIKDDILREKLLNVNLLIAKIDSLRDNPTPSSEVVIKSTSTFPNLFLEGD